MRRRVFLHSLGLGAVAGAVGWSRSSSGASVAPGSVTGSVTIERGRLLKSDRSGVVLYLEGVREKSRPPREPHEIRQLDRKFIPAVSAVVVGTTITFPNDDRIFHNVYSNSEGLNFDLGAYKSGTTKSVVVENPGHLEVFCNIHAEMRASVLVLETRYFTVTGRSGTFTIGGVPPGSYELVAWQDSGDEARIPVKVESGGTSTHELRLVEDGRRKRHLRKDGTPYARYR
jgi:plastocyanin